MHLDRRAPLTFVSGTGIGAPVSGHRIGGVSRVVSGTGIGDHPEAQHALAAIGALY